MKGAVKFYRPDNVVVHQVWKGQLVTGIEKPHKVGKYDLRDTCCRQCLKLFRKADIKRGICLWCKYDNQIGETNK